MSRDNVELSRAYFDEIARMSQEGFDPEATISRMAEFWDPEIEWDTSEAIALDISGVYQGIEGAREWCREWFTAWEALQFEYELADVGDRVVTLLDLRMRGRSTGIEVALGKHAWVATFRDGLMVHNKLYMSQSAALEAVGLSERATSETNVEIVRAAYTAWNAGDMDALRELHHPDVIARYPEGWPEPGPFVGREAVVRQLEQLRETWNASAAEPVTDFIKAGDRVVARFVWRGAGRGPAFALEGAAVYNIREGRIFGIEYFWDHAEALETLGLSE